MSTSCHTDQFDRQDVSANWEGYVRPESKLQRFDDLEPGLNNGVGLNASLFLCPTKIDQAGVDVLSSSALAAMDSQEIFSRFERCQRLRAYRFREVVARIPLKR